jgi:DNA-binding IclR family transcriptional regulator
MPSAQTAGVFNLSAPVLGPDGRAIAALTIPYISLVNVPQAPDMAETQTMLTKTSRQLSKLAGADFDIPT